MPPGSTVRFAMGRNIVRQCNSLIRETQGDWLWFQGDDHVFETDSLLRLLDHEVDVVVPLILMRQRPFPPLIFEGQNENGGMRVMWNAPPNELIEVYAAGTGGMLCSREALEAVGPDPFGYMELGSGQWLGEDFTLCHKFREAGVKIHCDTGVRMGHISTTTVWPEWTDDGWQVRLGFNSGAEQSEGASQGT